MTTVRMRKYHNRWLFLWAGDVAITRRATQRRIAVSVDRARRRPDNPRAAHPSRDPIPHLHPAQCETRRPCRRDRRPECRDRGRDRRRRCRYQSSPTNRGASVRPSRRTTDARPPGDPGRLQPLIRAVPSLHRGGRGAHQLRDQEHRQHADHAHSSRPGDRFDPRLNDRVRGPSAQRAAPR